jgi:rhamnose transport system ATP-binding protein
MAGLIAAHGSATGAVAHVALHDVSKQFGGVQALDAVSLEIASGAVHALVGENGAGKSTLGRIIGGAIQRDGGEMYVDGAPVAFRSPREALQHGIAAITQELLIVPGLTVAENVFLGVEPRAAGWVKRRSLKQRFETLAAEAGFDMPADQAAGTLRLAQQQQVEILRALARKAKLIVMDEPSAALSGPDVERLHEVIRSLTAAGRTVVLVSHFLKEVLELSDQITVMRDGRVIRTANAADETEDSLIQGMLGRPLNALFPEKKQRPLQTPVMLSVRGLSAPGVEDVSFELRAGEILALAGLVGAGRSELGRAIFGADKRTAGTVELAGERLSDRGPLTSLRRGLAMVPESRRETGLLFGRTVVDNVTLSSLAEHSRAGIVDRRSERAVAADLLARVTLTRATGGSVVATLSGGNQQKVLFARMLACRPKVLIVDEPTRGVDVGAKRAIYDLIAELAEGGTAVLVISSELEEVLGLAQRVLVMRRGRVTRELSVADMSEAAILSAAFAETKTTEQAA